MLRRFISRRSHRRVVTLNASKMDVSRKLAPMLERERARADRSGYELSLILMGLDGKPAKASHSLLRLIEVLERRCRITDDVGEFDKQTAFILLPDTEASGARHFAESIKAAMHRQSVEASYAIYSYAPAKRSKRKPPNDGDSGRGSGQKQSNSETVVARRIPRHKVIGASTPVAMQADESSVQDLKQALVRPLPIWKRAIDLAVAVPMLLLLWPLLVGISILIKIESRGPAVFRQQRAGLGGNPFWIYKFRTMVDGAEQHRDSLLHINEHKGPTFKIKKDPRITRLGEFLRKSSLDELPQLFNVLRGDMTLVGPRPLPCYEADDCEDWQKRRVEVTPGLTCIWQVSGRCGIDFDDWVRMDLAYQRQRTPGHDVRILMATVPAVLAQRGAQ